MYIHVILHDLHRTLIGVIMNHLESASTVMSSNAMTSNGMHR